MTHLEKLIRHAKRRCVALYIEHNDYKCAGIAISEELIDLVEDGEMDEELAEICDSQDSLWSIRYCHSASSFDITYHVNAEDAAEAMNQILGLD